MTILASGMPAVGPALLSVEPQLFVSDILASLAYYQERLGFETAFVHGEPPFYAQVVRDGLRLNFRDVEGPVYDNGFRQRESQALAATITARNIMELFAEFRARGAKFQQELKREEWGADMFVVEDPDGNLIAFAG
jgi:catechol 2,3-dioxygenase-like lactoylglutathione lyase family enzyme